MHNIKVEVNIMKLELFLVEMMVEVNIIEDEACFIKFEVHIMKVMVEVHFMKL